MNRAFRDLPRVSVLQRIAQRYVDHCNGDQDGDMRTNGECEVIRRFAPGSHTVFDVGANKGDWASEVLALNSEVSLHCFEPTQAAFRLLSARFSNPRSTIRLNQFGLGSVSGNRSAFLYGDADGGNSFYRRDPLSGNGRTQAIEERVSVSTLTDYCEKNVIERIDLLKIDVEGHEIEVLRGGKSLFEKRAIAAVQFEYGGTFVQPRVLLRDCFEFFAEHHYHLYKVFPNELRPVKAYDERLESFRYSNWLAVPSSRLIDGRPFDP
jgi:FkbM family methyltransferase